MSLGTDRANAPSGQVSPPNARHGLVDSGYTTDDSSLDEFIQRVLDEGHSPICLPPPPSIHIPPDYYASDNEDTDLETFASRERCIPDPETPCPPPRVAHTKGLHYRKLPFQVNGSGTTVSTEVHEDDRRWHTLLSQGGAAKRQREPIVGPASSSLDRLTVPKHPSSQMLPKTLAPQLPNGARKLRPLVTPHLFRRPQRVTDAIDTEHMLSTATEGFRRQLDVTKEPARTSGRTCSRTPKSAHEKAQALERRRQRDNERKKRWVFIASSRSC
ncbi:hypothetical protein VNI00_006461 [Paramarasmius palmivorus]|uniref:Uncharacterized protein n=1 Tax=Paramarasmius palmivorus TaxID=297713 RepID=A0AAW0DA70_9AGAR